MGEFIFFNKKEKIMNERKLEKMATLLLAMDNYVYYNAEDSYFRREYAELSNKIYDLLDKERMSADKEEIVMDFLELKR